MSTKLTIKVTKEILLRSAYCDFRKNGLVTNCAIALSIRDIFPEARVLRSFILPFYEQYVDYLQTHQRVFGTISLPTVAVDFIDKFDNAEPECRRAMEELEFEINIPECVIEKINIDEIRPLLVNHPTLQLV